MMNVSQTNPEVTIKVIKWTWIGRDIELAIDVPETTSSVQPNTIAGGFKRMTLGASVEGILAADTDTTQILVEKLWNIFEYGNPAQTYATFRGRALFGITSPTEGQLKITNLRIEENAVLSEPARNVSGLTSEPNYAKVTMELRKMKRSS